MSDRKMTKKHQMEALKRYRDTWSGGLVTCDEVEEGDFRLIYHYVGVECLEEIAAEGLYVCRRSAERAGVDLGEVRYRNIRKLLARYPDGFETGGGEGSGDRASHAWRGAQDRRANARQNDPDLQRLVDLGLVRVVHSTNLHHERGVVVHFWKVGGGR